MAYAYQADVWCDSCGQKHVEDLTAQGKAPFDSMDYSSFDSDDFPKSYDAKHDEADTPQHCAGCDEFLRNPLTSDGYAYVQSTLNDLPALTSTGKLKLAGHEILAEWAIWYDFRYWDSEDCEDYPEKHTTPGWYSDESF
jgi:hypothetical protein